jgi:hypothetical protein
LIILFFSGFSAYSLAKKLTNSEISSFYAGILYMTNPYTYIRIIVGYWPILLAYSLLPFGIKYFIELLENKDKKSIIKATLVTSLIALNAHTLFMAFMAYGIIFLLKLAKDKSLRLLKPVSLFAISFIAVNVYWLIPLLTAKSSSLVSYISIHDLYVFAPKIDSLSALFTLASMHGFWRPAYTYAKDYLPFWEVLFVVMFFLTVHGFMCYYKNKKVGIYVMSFALIWLIGLESLVVFLSIMAILPISFSSLLLRFFISKTRLLSQIATGFLGEDKSKSKKRKRNPANISKTTPFNNHFSELAIYCLLISFISAFLSAISAYFFMIKSSRYSSTDNVF